MRPFCIALIGSILGIIMGLYLHSIALFFIVFFIIIACSLWCKKQRKQLIIFGICFAVFYSYITFLENDYHQKYQNYGNQEVKLQAIVISNGKETQYKEAYQIKVVEIENRETGQKLNKPFYMICYIKKDSKSDLKYGDKIELLATYEVASTARNEGGFDYRQYLKTKQIAGSVNVSEVTPIADNQASWIATQMYLFKTGLIEKIKNVLPQEEAGICTALLLGDKSSISEETVDNFKKSSLSHMLAISGAHVSYILLGVTTLLNIFKIHKRWSKLFIIAFLIFFMALVDFTPSVTRACIMCILALLAELLFCKSDVYQNLAISLWIILLFNPYAILDIGLQLSFGGTLGIVMFMQKEKKEIETKKVHILLEKLNRNVKQIIKVSISANLIILPIMLYHYNTVSVTFVLSNLLASPILGLCLIMALIFIIFLIMCKPLAQIFSYFLNPIIQLLLQITKFTSKLPLSQILLPTPKIWQIGIYYLLLFVLFYKNKELDSHKKISKQQHYRKKAILWIAILLLMFPYFSKYIPTNYLSIHCIDVGQGDSILLETPSKKRILIDGGGSEMGSFNVGEQTLLPYLLDKGILSIDYMMFSHLDTDHCQGLFTILEKLKVRSIVISRQGENSDNFKTLLTILQKKKVKVIVVQAGDKVVIDKNSYFDILFPEASFISSNILNNNSIVAKFCMQNNSKQTVFSMLFTGDIEQIAENRIVELYQDTNMLQATILKVAHHRF